MTKRQYTILGMLLAAAGLHIWLDSSAQSNFKQFLTITPQNWKQLGANTISGYMLWFLGLAAILLLSDYWPTAAMWIAVLILTGAVLINSDPIVTWISNAENAIGVQPSATSSAGANAPD